jgi:hypothetical protein
MVMRLVLKAFMLTVIIFGLVNYAAYLQTGKSFIPMWLDKTMARIERFKQGASEALGSAKAPVTQDASAGIIYKWTDAGGFLQFTDVPPPEGIQAEIIKVDPNTNLIPAVAAPQPESEALPVAAAPTEQDKTPASPDMPFPYTPDQIKKTMDDARKAQQMMNDKLQKQQQILDQL